MAPAAPNREPPTADASSQLDDLQAGGVLAHQGAAGAFFLPHSKMTSEYLMDDRIPASALITDNRLNEIKSGVGQDYSHGEVMLMAGELRAARRQRLEFETLYSESTAFDTIMPVIIGGLALVGLLFIIDHLVRSSFR